MVITRSGGSNLRSYDAFAKPVDGLRTKTTSGGFVTLLASTTAGLLFLSQLYLYLLGETKQNLGLAPSQPTSMLFSQNPSSPYARSKQEEKSKIKISLHITFPHIQCHDLDYAHDNAFHSTGEFEKVNGKTAVVTRPMNTKELNAIFGWKKESVMGGQQRARPSLSDGCTLKGSIVVPKVGGSLSVTIARKAWKDTVSILSFGGPNLDFKKMAGNSRMHNVSHYIHEITFGEPFPLSTNPLQNKPNMITNESGVGRSNIAIKLIPTLYRPSSFFFSSTRTTYQLSMSHHLVQPATLAAQTSQLLPGMSLTYDFTPIAVRHVVGRESLLTFLGSLMGIVGGVFVTVKLVSGCLVDSAAAVAKKMD